LQENKISGEFIVITVQTVRDKMTVANNEQRHSPPQQWWWWWRWRWWL